MQKKGSRSKSQDGWWEERERTMEKGESRTGWGSDRETYPNKTVHTEAVDDKTRCLIKSGMSNFSPCQAFGSFLLLRRHSVLDWSLPGCWHTTNTPWLWLCFNLLTCFTTRACVCNWDLQSNFCFYHPDSLLGCSSPTYPKNKPKIK